MRVARGTFAVALISVFLEPKEKVLRRARDLPGTDGDGVYNSDVIYTHMLNLGPHGVVSPADAI